jgi:hypothetical protein
VPPFSWRLRENHRWYRETFFAFNCQLKKLNGEILSSWFDIRFTGCESECNFLIGSNLDRRKNKFPKISRKVKFLCFLIFISQLSTHLLHELLYFWWIPGRKNEFRLLFSIFYWKSLYNRSPVTREPVVR